MTNNAEELIVAVAALSVSAVLVGGAYRRWAWLVDPPSSWWPFYSQATIKKLFGTKATLLFTYFLGCTGMVFALLTIIRAVSR